jgi:peptidyl-prolyl cis-trans isomerase A (cyclophilin A)
MFRRAAVVLAFAALFVSTGAGCDKPPEPSPGPKPTVAATAAATTAAPAATTATAAAASDGDLPPAPPELLAPEKATEQAPATFKAKFTTTKGDFVVEFTRDWSPRGVDRAYNLVKLGFFSDVAFFRVVKDFVVQFGIHGNPKVSAAWRSATILDEQVKETNKKGYITFAKGGPDSRTTQLFISLKDNEGLDKMGFPPLGKVVEGMAVVESLYSGYDEAPSRQAGGQAAIQQNGNAHLKREFPNLDYIKSATIVK